MPLRPPRSPLFSLCRSCLLRRLYHPNTRTRRLFSTPTSTTPEPSSTPEDGTPVTASFQKSQKRSLKERNKSKRSKTSLIESASDEWEVFCGLEVHAQLNTTRKLFSAAKTSTTAEPNTHIAPFDCSLPGAQPRFNPAILLPALRAAVALQCTPSRESRFDRKHYFYWDQPAGYQITQFYSPLAKNGSLSLDPDNDGVEAPLALGIRQVQIEQDTGKTIAAPPNNLIDLNRVGAPLVEIITDPFPVPAASIPAKVLEKIQRVLKAVDACVVGMEWGGLRADVNVSVRPRGSDALGQRCEIKNLSSFKAVQDAVESEAARQIKVLEEGGVIEGETRGWDAEKSTTKKLRGKEGEVDYRYMPDPDLGPLLLSEELVQKIQDTMPPLPDEIVRQLIEEGLTGKDARTLLLWDDGRSNQPDSVVSYFRQVVEIVTKSADTTQAVGKIVGNWVIHELGGQLSGNWSNNPVSAPQLAELITLLLNDTITSPTAKNLLPRLVSEGGSAKDIVEREDLAVKPLSDEELQGTVQDVIASNEKVVQQYKAANEKKRMGLKMFFVGRVMGRVKGGVKPERIEGVVEEVLKGV